MSGIYRPFFSKIPVLHFFFTKTHRRGMPTEKVATLIKGSVSTPHGRMPQTDREHQDFVSLSALVTHSIDHNDNRHEKEKGSRHTHPPRG